MSTVFFKRKKFLGFWVGAIALLFTVLTLFYAIFLTRAKTAFLPRTFYFLVSESTHIEASTQVALLNGGAGYTLNYENREYVALSVYLTETEADSAHIAVSLQGQDSDLIAITCGKLYFKTPAEKKNMTEIVGALECLYDCLQVLSEEIIRLDEGATQESSKRILQTITRQFAYMQKTYEKIFPEMSSTCKKAKNDLSGIIEGVVYVKDLRYLACELCSSYVDLNGIFSL